MDHELRAERQIRKEYFPSDIEHKVVPKFLKPSELTAMKVSLNEKGKSTMQFSNS